MADYDSDYERVLDIIDASSGSEFSGFSSEETDISSDDDSLTEDWEKPRRMTVPMIELQGVFYLPDLNFHGISM